jgi:hypothetical protein
MWQFIHNIHSNPKQLFLLDALGACLTVLFLTGILIPFQQFFGMPLVVLEVLALVAVLLAFFSFLCFFFVKRNWSVYLKAIATSNILYCCLTTFFIVYHFEMLTALGLVYFLAEKTVILALAYTEMRGAYKNSEK